jgi:vancomycin resistance protein YoaR
MNDRETDKLLGELFKENAPRVNDALLHEQVRRRASRRKRRSRSARRARVVAVVCVSLALAIGVGYGAYRAFVHVNQEHLVVLVTDPTTTSIESASTTAAAGSLSATTTAVDRTADDLLAVYTTVYAGAVDRQANVKLTTELTDNVFLAPGEEYDFDKQIGARTQARGFKVAPGIVGPSTVEDLLGGALTQVATTLFNAACRAGLEVTERHNSSVYISHYPTGLDAAISAGGKDLRFVNDTDHYIVIKGTSDGITTRFEIYGTKDGRTVTISPGDFYNLVPKTTVTVKDPALVSGATNVMQSGQDGRELQMRRVVTLRDGTVLHDDTFVSVWPMIPETIAVGTKTASGQ